MYFLNQELRDMKYIIHTIIISLLPLLIAAQQGPLQVSISDNLEEGSGGNFEVTISASDFTDLLTFQLFLTWDDNLYRINETTFVNEDLPFFASGIILPDEDVSIPDPGKVRIIWADAAPVSLADETVLVTFSFTALGQACDISEFSFNDIGAEESERLSVVNAAFANIGLEFEPINVQVPGAACTTSTSDLANDITISVYPNPVIDNIIIDLDSQEIANAKMELFDVSGKLVKSMQLAAQTNNMDVSDLEESNYIYTIYSNNNLLTKGSITKMK